jgi:hypothetical protein
MKKTLVPICLSFLLQTASAFSRGNKCIPQVADGDNIRTKTHLINVGPAQSINNCIR